MKRGSFFITTLGCPKNEADTRSMRDSMIARGYREAALPEEAEFHLINSCAFIEAAKIETIETVFEAAHIKKETGDQKLILAGCFAERYEAAVKAEMPEVDLSFGTGLYHRAGRIIAERFAAPAADARVDPSLGSGLRRRAERPYAPVKISDGCDRGCAFCAIPNFRGAFQSRAAEDIIQECGRLAEEGVREINLVSQDTNAYGLKPEALVDLIESLDGIEELHWIRLLYMYPDARTERVLRGLAERKLQKFTPYLEAPIQHVAPHVLKGMRRAGSYERFRDLFGLARDLFPGLEIRTTLLLGFPGETEDDVELAARFLRETRPEKLAFFVYSPEEDTPGFELPVDVDAEEANRRVNFLRDVHLGLLRGLQRERVGRTYACMIDEVRSDEIVARRPQDAPEVDEAVFVDVADRPELLEKARPGDILNVRITGFFEYDLKGRPAE